MLLYLSSKHSNVILNVSIKKHIYYNEIYSIPAKSRGIMTIPAEPGQGFCRESRSIPSSVLDQVTRVTGGPSLTGGPIKSTVRHFL